MSTKKELLAENIVEICERENIALVYFDGQMIPLTKATQHPEYPGLIIGELKNEDPIMINLDAITAVVEKVRYNA
ncbi:hypothetical protein HT136_01250 [Novosphingobium profundi]|uniref:hypothetical protein n=1 Tax=Novosphingobium profundi TaxID=1774954 RepID=UPI001BDADEF1|nr:hypothetical protein [Novosphingobium profundi]MBT0666992.1 hypothetical protein [Novosphingobium profundi]